VRGFNQAVKVSTFTEFSDNKAETGCVKDIFDFDGKV